MKELFGSILEFPRVIWIAVILATIFYFPALKSDFFTDDFPQIDVLENKTPSMGGPFDLYTFANGNPDQLKVLMDCGPYPWWTLPTIRLAFFRPLSSALTVFDHALFGIKPLGYQVHTVLWYLLTVALAGILLQRTLPGPAGALALILFAVDFGHVMPATWIANRHATVSMALGLAGLIAHLSWREDGNRRGLTLSMFFFSLALLAGETALAVLAYLLAYEIFLEKGSLRWRVTGLAPALILGVVYFTFYRLMGYGTYGSGMYIDPIAEPRTFLWAAAGRIPALLGGVLLGTGVDFWILPALRPHLIAAGIAGVVAFFFLLRDALEDLPPSSRRTLGWLFTGGLLALIPQASTTPGLRMLLVPSLAGAVAIAVVLRQWWMVWKRIRTTPWLKKAFRSTVCVWLIIIHGVLAPVLILTQISALQTASQKVVDTSLQPELDNATVGGAASINIKRKTAPSALEPTQGVGAAGQRVVVVWAPDIFAGLYTPAIRVMRGKPLPAAWWLLSLAASSHELKRMASDSFELAAQGTPMLRTDFEKLFRGDGFPLSAGQEVALNGMRAKVLEVRDGGPTRVAFQFDRPLEDPSLCFMAWKDGALRKVVLPAVGQSILIAKSPGPLGF